MERLTVTEKRVERAKRMLKDLTPLRADCGALCAAACCRGDEKTGMLLFPGETTAFPVLTENGRRLAVCPGKCDRDRRPLSCRVFPFFPAPDETGRVFAAPDLRGAGLCPLLRLSDRVAFDRRFLRRVKTAGRFLARDDTLKRFLAENAAEIAETRAFLSRLTK